MENTSNSRFVYLPSDVDAGRYSHRNKASDYIVPLSHTLHLTPDWEVGLTEIIMPGCIYNIAKPWDRAMTITFSRKTYDREGHGFTKSGKLDIRVRPGQYTPEKYADFVNSVFERLEIRGPPKQMRPFKLFHGRLKYEHSTRKMAFHLKLGESISIKHPILRRMLGFTDKDPKRFEHRKKEPIVYDDDEDYEVKEMNDTNHETIAAKILENV